MTTTQINTDIPIESRYTIIETDIGPLISESRVSVFDVMEADDSGASIYEISAIFNLTPLQVETALAYIAKHRAALEPQLQGIIRWQTERQTEYRRQAAAIDAHIAALPMTPQRAALRALREKNATIYKVASDADHPE